MKASKDAVAYVDGRRYEVKKGGDLPGPVARAFPSLRGEQKPETKKEAAK